MEHTLGVIFLMVLCGVAAIFWLKTNPRDGAWSVERMPDRRPVLDLSRPLRQTSTVVQVRDGRTRRGVPVHPMWEPTREGYVKMWEKALAEQTGGHTLLCRNNTPPKKAEAQIIGRKKPAVVKEG